MIIPLLFWIAIVAGAVYLVQQFIENKKRDAPENRALDALGERYARGKIDRDEYLRRRNDIKGA